MKYCTTRIARNKMSQARHETGTLATVKYIALGTGGCDADGHIRIPLEDDVALRNELIRREYTSCESVSKSGNMYQLKLEANELVGENISEMALIDADGDFIKVCCFLPKGKDDAEVIFSIDDIY